MNYNPSTSSSDAARWTRLVSQVRAGCPAALEELYRVLQNGIRFHLWRQFGPQDLDDRVHDVFLVISKAIAKGEVRNPERLMGFVATVVRRHIATEIENLIKRRQRLTAITDYIRDIHPGPEAEAAEREEQDAVRRVMSVLTPREREVLDRFYIQDQPVDQICKEMGATETQVRLWKSRAKTRFGNMGRAMLKVS